MSHLLFRMPSVSRKLSPIPSPRLHQLPMHQLLMLRWPPPRPQVREPLPAQPQSRPPPVVRAQPRFLCVVACPGSPVATPGRQKGSRPLVPRPPRRVRHHQVLLRPRLLLMLVSPAETKHRLPMWLRPRPTRPPQLRLPPRLPVPLVRRSPRPGRNPLANSATRLFAADFPVLSVGIHGHPKALPRRMPRPPLLRPEATLQVQARPTPRRPPQPRHPPPQPRTLLPRLRSRRQARPHTRIPTPRRQLRPPQRELQPLVPVQPVAQLSRRVLTRSQRPPRRRRSRLVPDCRSPQGRRSGSRWPSLLRRPQTSRPRSQRPSRPTSLLRSRAPHRRNRLPPPARPRPSRLARRRRNRR